MNHYELLKNRQALIDAYNKNTPKNTQALKLENGEVKVVELTSGVRAADVDGIAEIPDIDDTHLKQLQENVIDEINKITSAEDIAELKTKLSAIGTQFGKVRDAQKVEIGNYTKTSDGRNNYIAAAGGLIGSIDGLEVEDGKLNLDGINDQLKTLGLDEIEITVDKITETTAEKLAAKQTELQKALDGAREAYQTALETFTTANKEIDATLGELRTTGLKDYTAKLEELAGKYNTLDVTDLQTALTNYLQAQANVKQVGIKLEEAQELEKPFN